MTRTAVHTSPLSAVLERHGLALDETTLAEALEAQLLATLPVPGSAGLPGDAVALLRAGGLDVADPLARGAATDAAVQAAAAMTALFAGALDVAAAARRLGIDPSGIRRRLGEGALVAVEADGRRMLPAFQFGPAGVLPHLRAVLAALPDGVHPLELHWFFTSPHPMLRVRGRAVSPADWLASGADPQPVLELAGAELP